MKTLNPIILLSCLLWLSKSGQSQTDTVITYFNFDKNPCKAKKAYYTIKTFKNPDRTVGVIEYKGHEISFSGSYLTEKKEVKQGLFKVYDATGVLKQEGYYKADMMHGDWKYYYRNGDLEKSIQFTNNVKNGQYKEWFSDGTLHEEGSYKNNTKEGEWTTIDVSKYKGQIKTVCSYVNGEKQGILNEWTDTVLTETGTYEHGKKTAEWIYRYSTGELKSKGTFTDDKRNGEWHEWYKNGQLTEAGKYSKGEKVGEWKEWYKDGTVSAEGVYVEGKEDGEWNYFFESGVPAAKEKYNQGELVNVKWWNEDGSDKEFSGETVVEPSFKGGEQEMMKYLGESINYPMSSIEMGEQGIVYVVFVVEKDGSISNIEVARGVSDAIDDEAVRVIEGMPKWSPGIFHNRIVRVRYTLPIHFRLG